MFSVFATSFATGLIARYGQDYAYLAERVQYLLKEDSIKAYTDRMKKEILLVPLVKPSKWDGL
ncbi:hypothetical protein Aasi_1682 [Candidatus Amoebophilus asiaticus 5a2]|uniref:Uncharacterized protein n=1 Tax=Amoebophilus asiaticus (strain 5a2) TaxID=452471 RepID=C3L3T8_AMOA5|nr:hypothetical protein [Candidatus Amoebophilus asiaticus]ACP20979.1 hypothetical protein Aasi_1682 [Candidatus Amoebophilus asiaticus 5a2]